MANDSTAAGYLTPPAGPVGTQDNAFEDFLHDVFAGLLGMTGDLIRPRWQLEPANMPDFSTGDWMSFGIMDINPDQYAYVNHIPDSNGSDEIQLNEDVTVLISTYGPNAMKNLKLIRLGLQVDQNREVLRTNQVGLTSFSRMRAAPSLVNDRYLHRWDMEMFLRRLDRATYTVENLVSVSETLNLQGSVNLITTSLTRP